MTRHVIIGNGVAGLHAAEAIRSLQPNDSITMIAAEAHPPYSRPMISMILDGSVEPRQIRIRPDDYYSRLNIDAVIGRRATVLDLDNKVAITEENWRVPFDRLLIATGADPRPIQASGSLTLGNIFFLRNEAHARNIVNALPNVKQALVLGGGLVGFKAAYGLMKRGIKVTMLIASDHPLVMQVDAESGKLILDELLARGLDVRVQVEVTSFGGNGTVAEARLSDGARLPCQLAVIAKGVTPAADFIPRQRIGVDLGIMVDRHLQTSEPGVYAAGDVAETDDVVRGTPWVNAVWPVAVEQGRIAGLNMAGRPVEYAGSLGRNTIRVFGLDVMTGGIVNPPDDSDHYVVSRLDPLKKYYRKLVFQEDRLAGMALVGHIEQGGILLSLMQRRLPLKVNPEALLEPNFNFACVFK